MYVCVCVCVCVCVYVKELVGGWLDRWVCVIKDTKGLSECAEFREDRE